MAGNNKFCNKYPEHKRGVCLCVFDEPQSAEAAVKNSASDTQPDSGKHQRPLETKFVPESTHKNTHTHRIICGLPVQSHLSVSSMWVSLFGLLAVQQFKRERNNDDSRNKAAQFYVQNKQTLKLFK